MGYYYKIDILGRSIPHRWDAGTHLNGRCLGRRWLSREVRLIEQVGALKPLADEADELLGPMYGLTNDEIAYVKQYDEKSRAGDLDQTQLVNAEFALESRDSDGEPEAGNHRWRGRVRGCPRAAETGRTDVQAPLRRRGPTSERRLPTTERQRLRPFVFGCLIPSARGRKMTKSVSIVDRQLI